MSTPWQEIVAPDEQIRFERYATEIRAMQQKAAAKGTPSRALHAKSNVDVVGSLQVQNVREDLRAGIFAEERTWPVYARFSNGSGAHQADGIKDVRGLAIKVVGVPGKKIIAGMEDAVTQDFLLIHTPSFPARTPEEFLSLLRAAAAGKLMVVPKLIGALGIKRTFAIVRGLGAMAPVASMATQRFYMPSSICIGDVAVRLSLVPDANDAPRGVGDNALRDDLLDRFKTGEISYTLNAQCYVDETRTPIEDASVAWAEENAPLVPLGRLVLPQQAIRSARGQEIERAVEAMSFDPWHALPAHRPLGAIMRARAPAYRESVAGRGGAQEPTTVFALE